MVDSRAQQIIADAVVARDAGHDQIAAAFRRYLRQHLGGRPGPHDQIGVLRRERQFRTQALDRLGPRRCALPLQDVRYRQFAAMIACDLHCPVKRPITSCGEVARQQRFESRGHGLSLKAYERLCADSFG